MKKTMSANVVVFTGYRDTEAEYQILLRGGQIGSCISKATTHLVAKDPSGSSGKLMKARNMGVKILSAEGLATMIKNS